MNKFSFKGSIPTSKSLMNRALVVKSYYPELNIFGASECDDVQHLQNSLKEIAKGSRGPFKVGEGGTTFRFLLARLTRLQGQFTIEGSHRLLSRPHQSLFKALEKMGAKIKVKDNQVTVESQGWQTPDFLKVDTSESSQFVSALLLNSWGLEKEFVINMEGDRPSLSYLQMTIELLQDLGMEIKYRDPTITIAPGQRLLKSEIELEPDMSSIFSLSCFAALTGELLVTPFPQKSRQPDFVFQELFMSLGIPFANDAHGLKVSQAANIKSLQCSLQQSPDLFPVLAVLLSQASGESKLWGLETLVHKESDRIQKAIELLNLMGVEHSWEGGEFKIYGPTSANVDSTPQAFDPDQDHRMVMAATLAQYLGFPIKVLNPDVVNKSFPEFFKILRFP